MITRFEIAAFAVTKLGISPLANYKTCWMVKPSGKKITCIIALSTTAISSIPTATTGKMSSCLGS